MGLTVAVSPSYAQRAAINLRARGEDMGQLTAMVRRWRAAADRTDRDYDCADDLDAVLHDTGPDELRTLATRWHALADLTGGNHRCPDEMDHWLAHHPADNMWSRGDR